jgi:hypothetical protein
MRGKWSQSIWSLQAGLYREELGQERKREKERTALFGANQRIDVKNRARLKSTSIVTI